MGKYIEGLSSNISIFARHGFAIYFFKDNLKAKVQKEWRESNPDAKGNMRDYANINQLICLSNMESINAMLINDGAPQSERLIKLNKIAIQQMRVLEETESRKLLK